MRSIPRKRQHHAAQHARRLEPATVSDRRYPELFQTGTAYGIPIVDGQHPHNFVDGVGDAIRAAHRQLHGICVLRPCRCAGAGSTCVSASGQRRGTTARPARNHWEDSTHIAYNVATVGAKRGIVRLEASGFYGQEPGENRWTISPGPMNSWSARLTLTPTPSWVVEVSTAGLHHPEAADRGTRSARLRAPSMVTG